MEITPIVVALIENVPAAVSVGFALVVAFVAFWISWKKLDVEGATSLSTMHNNQIKSLLEQIELLSKELKEAREQLHAIHEQNVLLMEQVRASNRRIGELELLLDQRAKTASNPVS
jgi:uncharacterized protein involved in exopolysaccharide biosynthesis